MKGVIDISAERLVGNLAAVQRAVGPEVEVLGVIKADAYGHGADLCAPVLAAAGLRWLGVADAEEGRRVRDALRAAAGTDDSHGQELHEQESNILVMCGFDPAEAAEALACRLTPVVWTVEHILALERASARLPLALRRSVPVHIEVDTGMARQGAVPGGALHEVLRALGTSETVYCQGIFTHLSCSEIAGSAETAAQRQRFTSAVDAVAASGLRPQWVHLANSSAIDEGSTLNFLHAQAARLGARAMVRPGLALYGYALPLAQAKAGDPAPESQVRRQLEPVARWTTGVTGLREVVAGQPVGYGATFRAERTMQLALLPVGYADGFRREASSGLGGGWAMLGGLCAPVVGRVSMNLTVVDVTAHAAAGLTVALGSEAVLLGQGVSAEDHARWAGTIPYEILCGLRGHRRLG